MTPALIKKRAGMDNRGSWWLMKCFHLTIWGLGLCLLMGSSITRAEEIKEKPIARVFHKQLYYSDISQNSQQLPPYLADMNAEERADWIKDREIKALESLIYSELQNKFLKDSGMLPTEEDIQQFITFNDKEDAAQPKRIEVQREDILIQLQAEALTDSERDALNDHLKTVNQLIEFDKKRKEDEALIPNYDEVKKKSHRSIGLSFVTAWKFNKALYSKYGGRVIFQQAGCEAIDAYKAFLEEHRQAQSFEIYDTMYADVFKDMDLYFEMGHNYIDKEAADKYFSMPWWDPAFEPL